MADSFELLTACCMPAGAAATTRVRGAVATARDWAQTLQSAERHGLLPIVCRRVLGVTADLIDASARERIGAAARATAARSLAAARQQAVVIGTLDAAGIAALPYKGPALAADAYGDAALRDSDDLDVVVAPEDFGAAARVLAAAGYAPANGQSWNDARVVHDWQGHVPSVGAPDRLPVELHWRFCDRKLPWSPGVRDVISRASHREIAGARMWIPERHDQLVLVLLHAARHGWDRLEPLACAAALIAQGVDADTLLARARDVGGVRATLMGLALAVRLLEIALPSRLQRAIDDDEVLVSLVDAAEHRLRRGSTGDGRDAWLHLTMLDSPAAQVRYVALYLGLATPRDRAVVTLPPRLSFLYLPVRLARLALRAANAW